MIQRILIGALLAAALAACHRASPPPAAGDPGAASEGRLAYERSCGSCHGPAGRGDGPVAAALQMAPPDLTVLATRNGGTFPRDAVVAVVTGDRAVAAHGSREMPVWALRYEPTGNAASAAAALVQRRRLDLLVDYVERLQAPAAD